MNELELLTRMRSEVPPLPPGPRLERELAHPSARRAGRVRGIRLPGARGARAGLLIACSAAAAAVVAGGLIATRPNPVPAQVTQAWSGRPAAPAATHGLSVGRARTGAQLVTFASRAAALAPQRAPGPHDWVYMKVEQADSTAGGGGFLFGPPNKREFYLSWIRVDFGAGAALPNFPASMPPLTVVHTRLTFGTGGPFGLGGWKSVSYHYLASLPTSPAALRAVILSQNKPNLPWYQPDNDVAVFSTVATLLTGQTEGVWIPPRLAAAMYRLLQQTPGVHFDTAADLAGRTGLGFYMVIDGWQKHELVINPSTYSYMGDEWVAIKAHTSVATDGTRYIKKGQVLGWEALLASAIVKHAGQLP
jgi:hypothetical protein